MPLVTNIQREHQKSVVRHALTLNPNISVRGLKELLDKANPPMELSRPYLTELVEEVRVDRIREVEEETKEELYAKIADIVHYVNTQLRAIANEEKLVYTQLDEKGVPKNNAETRIFAQNNRIKALNSVVKNTIDLIQLKMDLGIIERKLGTADLNVIDIVAGLEKIRNGDYTTPLPELIARKGIEIASSTGSDDASRLDTV